MCSLPAPTICFSSLYLHENAVQLVAIRVMIFDSKTMLDSRYMSILKIWF